MTFQPIYWLTKSECCPTILWWSPKNVSFRFRFLLVVAYCTYTVALLCNIVQQRWKMRKTFLVHSYCYWKHNIIMSFFDILFRLDQHLTNLPASISCQYCWINDDGSLFHKGTRVHRKQIRQCTCIYECVVVGEYDGKWTGEFDSILFYFVYEEMSNWSGDIKWPSLWFPISICELILEGRNGINRSFS